MKSFPGLICTGNNPIPDPSTQDMVLIQDLFVKVKCLYQLTDQSANQPLPDKSVKQCLNQSIN